MSEQTGQSFGQTDPVCLIVRVRGYQGWIEYIERVLSSLALVFNKKHKIPAVLRFFEHETSSFR